MRAGSKLSRHLAQRPRRGVTAARIDSLGRSTTSSVPSVRKSLIQGRIFPKSSEDPMQAPSRRIYRFDRFELDAHRRQLWCEGQLVTLQPKALDLLVALVESGGNVLTKDELLNLVWPGQVVEESNLTVHMSALRKALGERKGEHRFVVTQPGRGYRFVADVDDVQATTDADALLPTPAELPMERPRARVAMWLGSGSLLCAVLIAGAVAYWRGDIRPTPATSASGAAAPEMTIKRLTTSGRVSTATLSPDGKFFAYVHRGNRRAIQPVAQSRRGKRHRQTARADGSHWLFRDVCTRRHQSLLLSRRSGPSAGSVVSLTIAGRHAGESGGEALRRHGVFARRQEGGLRAA